MNTVNADHPKANPDYRFFVAHLRHRIGIAVLALALPLLLAIGGCRQDPSLPLQGSMSAYYHAGDGVMRNVFVGTLCAVGAFLFLYKGVTKLENWSLNVAGALVVGVALIPMAWPEASGTGFSWHGFCAVSFFICIAYVCAFRARDTLELVKNETTRKCFWWTYIILGALMVLSPGIAYLLKFLYDRPGQSRYIFVVEAAGVYIFAIYWLVKSREMALTHFDEKAAHGEVAVKPPGLQGAFRASVVQQSVGDKL